MKRNGRAFFGKYLGIGWSVFVCWPDNSVLIPLIERYLKSPVIGDSPSVRVYKMEQRFFVGAGFDLPTLKYTILNLSITRNKRHHRGGWGWPLQTTSSRCGKDILTRTSSWGRCPHQNSRWSDFVKSLAG